MKPLRITILAAVWLLLASLPASAQVERVIVETDGLSTACQPGLEAALKTLDSIYKYAISVQKQVFTVFYYDGEKFVPKDLRWAADTGGEADVVRIHVSARGKVTQDGERQFLVSGEDRFLIVGEKRLPAGVPLGVIGAIDDTVDPMQLLPDDFKLLKDDEVSPAPKPGTGVPSEK